MSAPELLAKAVRELALARDLGTREGQQPNV